MLLWKVCYHCTISARPNQEKNFLKKWQKQFTNTDESCIITKQWGCSSVGRALEWHSRGRRFDPDHLHQKQKPRRIAQAVRFFVKGVPAQAEGLSGHPFNQKVVSLTLRFLLLVRAPPAREEGSPERSEGLSRPARCEEETLAASRRFELVPL